LVFKKINPELIKSGGSIEEAAKIFTNILEGNGTDAQNSVVLANSALAIHTIRQNEHIEDSVEEAKSSLFGGKALQALKTLIK
jgi:anthranilate phosphoribosyltransferase